MRRTRLTRGPRAALVAPLAALTLLLGACSDGGDAPESPSASAEDAPTEEPPETPEAEETEETAASEGAACVAGTWLSDAEAQAAAATSALDIPQVDATATVTGDSLTTFADGTMTTEYRDQVVTVQWTMQDQTISMVTRWSGTLTGTAEVTDEQLVISAVDSSGLEMSYETTIGGEVVELPGMEEIPMSGLAAGGTSTYTCSGDELRVTPVVEGVDTSGFVTVLHRQ